MKVKELIKELKECNQEAIVSIVVGSYDENIIDAFVEVEGLEITENNKIRNIVYKRLIK